MNGSRGKALDRVRLTNLMEILLQTQLDKDIRIIEYLYGGQRAEAQTGSLE